MATVLYRATTNPKKVKGKERFHPNQNSEENLESLPEMCKTCRRKKIKLH
jgi:hypothetical protein